MLFPLGFRYVRHHPQGIAAFNHFARLQQCGALEHHITCGLMDARGQTLSMLRSHGSVTVFVVLHFCCVP